MYLPSLKNALLHDRLIVIKQVVAGIVMSVSLQCPVHAFSVSGIQALNVGDDYTDKISALSAVVVGNASTISRTDDSGAALDHDWIPVQLIAGKSYVIHDLFNKQFTVGDGHGLYYYTTQTFISLRNSQGRVMPNLVSQGRDFAFSIPTSGRYYLDVSGIASTININAYQDDFVDNRTSRASLVLSAKQFAAMNGNIEVNGDHDWLKATLIAGKNYLFTVKSGQNGLAYPELQLYDSFGKAITLFGQGTHISFTPPTSGTYYAGVASWLDNQSFDIDYVSTSSKYKGVYTLTLSQKNDDYGNDQSTAGSFSLPGADHINISLNSHIETKGDRDWLAIKLLAHKTYDFSITDSNAKLFALALYDAENNLLRRNTAAPHITYTTGRGGRYYLNIKALSKNITDYYHLYAISYPDAYPDYIANVKPLVPGAKPISENLSAQQDHDWFPIKASVGKRYKILLSSGYDGYHFFPLAALHDASGNLITRSAWQYLSRDDRFFEFIPAKSGMFYVDVNGSECGTCVVYGSSGSTNTRYDISLQVQANALK